MEKSPQKHPNSSFCLHICDENRVVFLSLSTKALCDTLEFCLPRIHNCISTFRFRKTTLSYGHLVSLIIRTFSLKKWYFIHAAFSFVVPRDISWSAKNAYQNKSYSNWLFQSTAFVIGIISDSKLFSTLLLTVKARYSSGTLIFTYQSPNGFFWMAQYSLFSIATIELEKQLHTDTQ